MNTLGEYFTFTSFGESHGRAIGGVIDGVPAGLHINMQLINQQLNRRAGRISFEENNSTHLLERQSKGVSTRAQRETDEVEWLSGVMDGVTLGTPIAFIIRNRDAQPEDYEWLKHSYRVGHADKVYQEKYGIRDYRGGGRASARETASRVVAGSIARQLLEEKNIHIHAELVQVGNETNPARFEDYISKIRQEGDSIGGIVQCTITGLPIGIGDPIFDKLQSHLAFAVMSINACKGFEYGSGFSGITLKGSEMYLSDDQQLISGGIAGGIADGTPIIFRCVFKPTASNRQTLEAIFDSLMSTYSANNQQIIAGGTSLKIGRHDACVAVRAVPVVEAMTALALQDLLLFDSAKH